MFIEQSKYLKATLKSQNMSTTKTNNSCSRFVFGIFWHDVNETGQMGVIITI